jgi:hypothetical protein
MGERMATGSNSGCPGYQARTEPVAARQLLHMLTFACRTLARFEEERAYLSKWGIPAEFLPSARELDRTDLV